MSEQDWWRIANAQLMYYMHIPDPDSLDDETWASRIKELQYIRNKEKGA